MFGFITRTWTPIAMHCGHGCLYCWSEKLKKGRLKNSPKYKDLSQPRMIEKELTKTFNQHDFTFVEPMGDLFGEWVPEQMILDVLAFMHNHKGKWLLLTKNPKRMWEFKHHIPNYRTTIGITLETNRVTRAFSKAPVPLHRAISFSQFPQDFTKFVCIEPIMDFDLEGFLELINLCDPKMVAVGYDNYNNNLPEPSLEKTEELIRRLSLRGIEIIRKTLREKHERTDQKN